jgi:hypothetical protein
MLIRILTEDKNRTGIIALLSGNGIDGATIIPATGIWRGVTESSIAIDIIATDDTSASDKADLLRRACEFASQIKRINDQDAVLIETIENSAFLI